jgi:hypothetical protein
MTDNSQVISNFCARNLWGLPEPLSLRKLIIQFRDKVTQLMAHMSVCVDNHL